MQATVIWNPWHGCTKLSAGCKYCYVYRQDAMYGVEQASSEARLTGNYRLPVKHKRDGSWKIAPGTFVYTCLTSDFFLDAADQWRIDAWAMIRLRSDCTFLIFTKRIDRFMDCVPEDWGDGYDNVIVACTAENQEMVDYRLPIFLSLPIKHRVVAVAPMLSAVNVMPYIGRGIEMLTLSGESGDEARVLDYDWVLDLRRQCVACDVPFMFFHTGAKLLKDGKLYRIKRALQNVQARKAGIDYRITDDMMPY